MLPLECSGHSERCGGKAPVEDRYSCPNESLTIKGVTLEDIGDPPHAYHAVLTNKHGSVESNKVRLILIHPPNITSQPSTVSVSPGETTTMTVEATGGGELHYQWVWIPDTGDRSRVAIPGSTGPTLTIANAQPSDSGMYRVKVWNEDGSRYSHFARLKVVDQSEDTPTPEDAPTPEDTPTPENTPTPEDTPTPVSEEDVDNPTDLVQRPPEILSSLEDLRIEAGETLTLSIDAQGEKEAGALRYQWQRDFVDIPNATEGTLVIPDVHPEDAGRYSVTVSNNEGSARYFPPATVVVLSEEGPPTITRQPVDTVPEPPVRAVIYIGKPGYTAYLSVGFGPTRSIPTIQWLRDGVVLCDTATGQSIDPRHDCGTAFPGLNGYLSMGDLEAADVGTTYQAILTNNEGAVRSQEVKLLAMPEVPRIVSSTQDAHITLVRGNQLVITKTLETPAPANLRFEWSKDFQKIDGADGPTLVIENVQPDDEGLYLLKVSSDAGSDSSTSQVYVLTEGAPVITSPLKLHPDAPVALGDTIQFRIEAKDAHPRPNVQWRRDEIVICDPQNESIADPRYRCDNGYQVEVLETPSGGRVLVRQGGPSLKIQDVVPADAGTYDAVLTNQHGSLTSPTKIALTLPPPPSTEDDPPSNEDGIEQNPLPNEDEEATVPVAPSCVPRSEACDGQDNDCNGLVDDLPDGWCDEPPPDPDLFSGMIVEKDITAGGTPLCARTTTQAQTTQVSYHTNYLSSVEVVTDADGSRVDRIAYKPYGGAIAAGESISQHTSYTGQELDQEVGLYNYRARLYDPALGRFISADTVVPDPASPQTLNRYAYVYNNPINFNDPTGHTGANFFGDTSYWIGNTLPPIPNLAGSGFEFFSPSPSFSPPGNLSVPGLEFFSPGAPSAMRDLGSLTLGMGLIDPFYPSVPENPMDRLEAIIQSTGQTSVLVPHKPFDIFDLVVDNFELLEQLEALNAVLQPISTAARREFGVFNHRHDIFGSTRQEFNWGPITDGKATPWVAAGRPTALESTVLNFHVHFENGPRFVVDEFSPEDILVNRAYRTLSPNVLNVLGTPEGIRIYDGTDQGVLFRSYINRTDVQLRALESMP